MEDQATIELYRGVGADCWMSKHSDPRVLELFKTNEIPTAFSSKLPAWSVKREIEKLNPGVRVVLVEREGGAL